MPVGVVGAITPWNFPIAIPSWKLAPALVCGNTVVFKPAEDTPLLAERFVELLAEAGLPDGVVNLVHGYGEEVGDRARRATPTCRVITFTGSRETGVAVTKAAADGLKHVHLELGGKNAIIVMDDADLDLAVEGIVWSAFGTSGQRCTAASRVIVHEEVYDELQSRLVARAEEMRLGPGWEDDDRHRAGDQPAARSTRSTRTRRSARTRARSSLTGGEVATDGELGKGFYYRPTIFGDVDAADAHRPGGDLRPDDRAHPGRATSTRRCAVANGDRVRALVVDLHARRQPRVPRDARSRRPGSRTSTPARPAPRCTCPFGGTKDTGNGHREAGQAALDVFTEWKSIYVDYSGRLQRAQIDTN